MRINLILLSIAMTGCTSIQPLTTIDLIKIQKDNQVIEIYNIKSRTSISGDIVNGAAEGFAKGFTK